jgi:hypothetical protein
MSSRLGGDPGGLPSEIGVEAFHPFHSLRSYCSPSGMCTYHFDNNNDDGDARIAAGTRGAGGGEDVDWDDVPRDE